ncbi:MAG: radical SAM family heme chaperone HemW [Deltaproteobacteria bacterium]|nr:radical SAM family heme chaperone HemW [Deltaproteobacteria bacterium]MBW2017603.1 radical SAM family heme chaperone HemW [Deltaproteobacteria bacterium]MBW2130646.1 radical SAM family heme chaperone HemW [Deltaproteobacteria bacterium]
MSEGTRPGLYVHVPFCKSKCPYCDFYSVTSPSRVSEWLEALEKEVRIYREHFPLFDSLYFGGGTPSLLEPGELKDLLSLLFNNFSFSPDAEFTLEANPDDVTASKADLFLDLGLNRISLGAQSFIDRELRLLGRRHTASQTERAVEHLARAGFKRIGIDLIYGLPGQGESDWLESLDQALSLDPDHVSCYQLTLAGGTPFEALMKRGRIRPPSEAKARRLFLIASDHLEKRGYVHYEVSNYAGNLRSVCRHNLKYWRRGPYLGLGPSAHSFSGGERWWNHRSLGKYVRDLSTGRPPVEGQEKLSPEQHRMEALLLGFRTLEGVDLSLVDLSPNAGKIIAELCRSELIRRDGGKIVPTRKGFLVADSLPLLFC